MLTLASGNRNLTLKARTFCALTASMPGILISLLGLSAIISPSAKAAEKTYTAEELAAQARQSVVTLTHQDRRGNHNGMGTGFVITADGLIATSLHVIGEARPIGVRFADGETYDVEAVHAWDRKLDLAIIKIKAQELSPLPLGNSDQLRNGQSIVAIGNPMGLEQSIVTGVVSGIREFEHSDMIQLAIPIEPGNSGGPLLDLQGRVHGLLNLKSTVTENLGFATPINQLKPLLAKPNTVPIDRWLRIGALDTKQWQTTMGAHWSQLTGRIKVTGEGNGFGGRALCLQRNPPLDFPYEVEVTVRLKDESGAAGLVFGSDGGDRHYGFYPSSGQIRLTRFDGENVFSWNILHQIPSPHYRAGDWNHLRIRHTPSSIEGYLNGQLILRSADRGLGIGRVGMAKFRNTEAEFKNFRIGRELHPQNAQPENEAWAAVTASLGNLNEIPQQDLIDSLAKHPDSGQAWLNDQAQQLELEALRLRRVSHTLHRLEISRQLEAELAQPEEEIDLLRAALLIAKHDKPELSIEAYLQQADHMAREIRANLSPEAPDATKVERLTKYLFHENGFHGSYFDYRNNANSYLNNVIDDREGLPITLSILFLELGRRLEIVGLSGFPLPYHFLVKFEKEQSSDLLIDVFNQGKLMSYDEANALVARRQNAPFQANQLASATKLEIVNRMLRNLISFTQEAESLVASLPYLDLLVALNPKSANNHLERAWIHLRSGNSTAARLDLQWIIDHEPPGINLARVREALDSL